MGPRGFEPRLPTPQAGVIVQATLRPQWARPDSNRDRTVSSCLTEAVHAIHYTTGPLKEKQNLFIYAFIFA